MSTEDVFHQSPRPLRDPAAKDTVRIVHISDTHDEDYDRIPLGDILVHTGDFTNRGKPDEVKKFVAYLKRQPHPNKIVIGGNHEMGLDQLSTAQLQELITDGGTTPNVHFLNDSGATVCGIKFYGSPWTSSSMAWGARSKDRAEKWAKIPADTDILLTHSPPFGILDLAWVKRDDDAQPCATCGGRTHRNYQHWGCQGLLQKVDELRIPIHCFGHVHDDSGILPPSSSSRVTTFSNAAMDIKRRPCVIDVLVTDKSKTDPVPLTATQEKLLQQQKLQQQQQQQHAVATPTPPTDHIVFSVDSCRLAPHAWSRHCVLDLDSHDRRRGTLLFWQGSRTASKVNQLWRIQQRGVDAATGYPLVAIESCWTEEEGNGPTTAADRAIGFQLSSDIGRLNVVPMAVSSGGSYPQECLWRAQKQDGGDQSSSPLLLSFENVAYAGCFLATEGSWQRGDLKLGATALRQVGQDNEHLWVVQQPQN